MATGMKPSKPMSAPKEARPVQTSALTSALTLRLVLGDQHNPRIGMAYRQLEKMPEPERDAIRAQAKALRARINHL
jgi:hypothetical protein